MKIAKFICLKCKYEWVDFPGPTQCPNCGYLYVKWINYNELRKIWNKDKKNYDLI